MASNRPIADYALIGDCHGAALVGLDGAIDWACIERFDSGAEFCRLLDVEKGGTFQIVPVDPYRATRRYLPDTNVLETTFETATGSVCLVDCFAMRRGGAKRPYSQLLRRVEGVRGTIALDVLIEPRFDYATVHPWLRHDPREDFYSAVGGDDGISVTADCALEHDRDASLWRARIEVADGERVRFTVTASNPHDLVATPISAAMFEGRLRATVRWWERWTAKGREKGATDPASIRSALVLKLLTCAPTGAIIAAPTTSLPGELGGTRNYDYRFTWIRDATMTLAALMACGHAEVATGFKRFIEIATAGRPEELQIMYGCYGQRRLTEIELPHLAGYEGSKPVRIGNGAAKQTQLDVYGELLDAATLWRRAGSKTTPEGWQFLRALVDTACERWREPDHGLWEMRGPKQHFVYSKVMCWLAIARGIELAMADVLGCDIDRWMKVRDEIRDEVLEKGVDPERKCFVQAYGSKEMDASLLRLPMLGFIDARDPRMLATTAAVIEDLSFGDLIRRYRMEARPNKHGATEGAFMMTTLWLVDVLAMSDRVEEAEALYAHVMSLANDVGLFAEQFDAARGIQLGNFPQAFTHIAQITAAEQLRRVRKGKAPTKPLAERDSEREAPRNTEQQKSTR